MGVTGRRTIAVGQKVEREARVGSRSQGYMSKLWMKHQTNKEVNHTVAPPTRAKIMKLTKPT